MLQSECLFAIDIDTAENEPSKARGTGVVLMTDDVFEELPLLLTYTPADPMRSWKKRLKNKCIVFAWRKIGVMKRQTWPLVIDGPQLAPSKYNEHVDGIP